MSKKISALIVFGLCASLFYWSELKLEQLVEIQQLLELQDQQEMEVMD